VYACRGSGRTSASELGREHFAVAGHDPSCSCVFNYSFWNSLSGGFRACVFKAFQARLHVPFWTGLFQDAGGAGAGDLMHPGDLAETETALAVAVDFRAVDD
jgi:hypothetical protein